MAKNNNYSDFNRGIADVLRAVKGDSALINPQDFENEICSAIVNTPSLQTITERTTANGADIEDGVAFIKSIRGNSLKWMQLAKCTLSNPYTTDGITITQNADGSISVVGTSTRDITNYVPCMPLLTYPSGHRLLLLRGKKSTNQITLYDDRYTNRTQWEDADIYTGGNGIELYFSLKPNIAYNYTFKPMLFDLTEMGMESITSADAFAQALGYSSASAMPALPYSATTIKHFNARKVVSKDADGEQIDTLDLASLDLWSAGSAYDEVDLAKGTKTKRIGKRAYESGDENNSSVLTDGTYTYYALATPTTSSIDKAKAYFKVENGGKEMIVRESRNIWDSSQSLLSGKYADGNAIQESGGFKYRVIKVKKNTNYTLKVFGTFTDSLFCGFVASQTPSVGDVASSFRVSLNYAETANSGNYEYLLVAVWRDHESVLSTLQIEEGSTAHSYEPYGMVTDTDSSPLKAEIGYKYNLEVSTTSEEDGE